MSSHILDPAYLFEQYEVLRKEAREAGRRGHGLALFLSRGMFAWIMALRMLAPRPVRMSDARSIAYRDLPSSVRSDLTIVLADMVLSCSQEA